MSLLLIFQIIFIFSIIVIAIILFRTLPVLVDFEPQPIPKERRISSRLKKRSLMIKDKLNEKLHQFREKNVHRLRVLNLKIDNFLTSYLTKIREKRLHQENKQAQQKKTEPSSRPEKESKLK